MDCFDKYEDKVIVKADEKAHQIICSLRAVPNTE